VAVINLTDPSVSETMLIVTGIIRVESEDELVGVKAALVKRAIKSRQDAGNIDYAFSVSVEDPPPAFT